MFDYPITANGFYTGIVKVSRNHTLPISLHQHIKSSNHLLSLQRPTYNSSSTTDFPWPTSILQSNTLNIETSTPDHYGVFSPFLVQSLWNLGAQLNSVYCSLLQLTACFYRLLLLIRVSQSQSHIATDGQSVCLSWCRAPSGAHDQIFVFDSYCLVLGRAPSLTRGRVCRLSVSQQY
jgi:hypothetical protein